jgi:nucleoside-diphosphate-sugar epimerase
MLSVFGGTGFLGSEFCRHTEQLHVRIPREVRQPVSRDILYLISTTDNYNVHTDPHKDVRTNLTVLLEVLERCEPGTVVNFVSSWFVYGMVPIPAKEDGPCDPRGFYSITKRAAEQLLISFCETKGLSWRIFRMANLYGPGDRGCSRKKNAMQWLIGRICAGEDIELYHGGHVLRDYLHVSDAARAIDLCLRDAPLRSIINVGTGSSFSLRNVLDFARDLTGSKSRFLSVNPPQFHNIVQTRDFRMDCSRIQALGFKPRITMKEGIRELCRTYREGK